MKKTSLLVLAFSMLLSASAFSACSKKPVTQKPDEKTSYVVTFSTNEGTAVENVTVKNGENVDLSEVFTEREGMYFIGWYLDAEFKTPASLTFAPDSDITLYARWGEENVTRTLTFDSQGGNEVAAAKYAANAYLVEPEAPTRENYVFDGWYYDQECTKEFFFFGFTMPNKDLTVYAKWTEVFEIAFETNGGSAVEALTGAFGDKVTAPEEPTKEGYIFDGWFKDEALSEPYYFSTIPQKSLTIYAGWHAQQKDIKINLHSNLAGLTDFKKSFTYNEGEALLLADSDSAVDSFYSAAAEFHKTKFLDQTVDLLKNPLYVFNYWTYDAEGTDLFYGEIPADEDGEIDLYATWNRSAKYCGVTFDMNGLAENEFYYVLKNSAMPEANTESVAAKLNAFYAERGCEAGGFVTETGEVFASDRLVEKDVTLTVTMKTSGLEFTYNAALKGYELNGFTAAQKTANVGKTNLLLIVPETYNDGKNGEAAVVSIAANAFGGEKLTEARIANGVAYFGDGCFADCASLATVVYGGKAAAFGGNVFKGTAYEGTMTADGNYTVFGGNVLYKYTGSEAELSIPSKYTVIAGAAFDGNATVKKLTVSNNAVYYGDGCFANMGNLSEAEIGSGFTGETGKNMFAKAVKLENVTFNAPISVKAIPAGMFESCAALTSFDLSGFTALTEIGAGAFKGCTALASVTFPEGFVFGDKYFGSLKTIGESAFEGCAALAAVTLEKTSVETIGASAFAGCAALESAVLPSSLKTVGAAAFKNCTALKAVTLYAENTTFAPDTFEGAGYTPLGGEFTLPVLYVLEAKKDSYAAALEGKATVQAIPTEKQ